MIDENLPRFFKIKQTIDEIIEKYPDFVVIEKDEKQQETEKQIWQYKHFFDLDQYYRYLSQSGIDFCNTIV